MGSEGSRHPSASRMPCFNPRSRMGSDDLGVVGLGQLRPVSIHAPAWGATGCCSSQSAISLFQSTLPHGERRWLIGWFANAIEFQSTLPHGERRGIANIAADQEKGRSEREAASNRAAHRSLPGCGTDSISRFQTAITCANGPGPRGALAVRASCYTINGPP